ncbi:MAG: sugar phosphate isomerase/epimerase [Clostridiales bacterium]|nr:sugar phosphate isomerase/epimerase [Clostridiales bacterium]
MKISFSTLGCPRWSWKEIVSTAKDLGYQGVEVRGVGKDISVPSVPAFSDSNIAKTKENLQDLALSIPCLDSDCLIYLPHEQEKTFQEVQAYVSLAKKLSVSYVRVFAAPAVPEPAGEIDDAFVRDHTRQLADMAKEQGITLLLETHGVWCDSARLARLLTAIDKENVGILWDIHHPFRYLHESAEKTFHNIAPWLKHTHIKDSILQNGKVRYVPCGQGDLPLEEIFTLLQKNDYQGFYSLEWVKRWDTSLEEPGIIFAHYANYMSRFA